MAAENALCFRAIQRCAVFFAEPAGNRVEKPAARAPAATAQAQLKDAHHRPRGLANSPSSAARTSLTIRRISRSGGFCGRAPQCRHRKTTRPSAHPNRASIPSAFSHLSMADPQTTTIIRGEKKGA